MKLYKIEKNKSDSLNEEDIDSLIRLLGWANQAFADGKDQKRKREDVAEKLRNLQQGMRKDSRV